jgi:K+-sensing histidine kinase KdpD
MRPSAARCGGPASPNGEAVDGETTGIETQPLSGAGDPRADLMTIFAQEMRGPLTVVKGYTQRLLMSWESLDDKGKVAILGRINTSISRLHRLVDDIAVVAGDGSTQFTMLARPFLLEPVVQQAIQEVAARHGDRATAIVPSGENVSLYGDCYRLEQVLLTYLELAVLRSPPGCPITVAYDQEGAHARIAITMEGGALPAAEWPALFGGSSMPSAGSLALDLLIATRLLRALGGILKPTGAGDTTCLIIEVPVSSQG